MLCSPATFFWHRVSNFTHSSSFWFLSVAILLFSSSTAFPLNITPPPNSNNLSVNIAPWAQGRLFAVSDAAPYAHHLQHQPDYVHALGVITSFFSSVEHQINCARRSAKSMRATGRPCNADPETWHTATHKAAMNRGWPVSEPNGSVCITYYYGVPPSFPTSAEQLREVMQRGLAAVERSAYRVMLETVGNWTYTGGDHTLDAEFASQICELSNYGGFRLHGKWNLAIASTNQPAKLHLPDGERLSLSEMHRLQNGTIVSALMTLPINPGTGEVHSVTDRATTMLARWGGAANPASRFEPSTVHNNVALMAAREKGSNFAQQMEDVILGSNTAILALPLVLNLIPVSLITVCKKWTMLMYVLFSDILTALPMLIKGIELVGIGKSRFTEVVTRVGDTFEKDTIAIETWVATCRVRHDAGIIGIVFITSAFVAVVVGVLLELIAYSMVIKARRKRKEYVEDMEYLDQYERHAWKHCDEVFMSRLGMTQHYQVNEGSRPLHDTWTPMPTSRLY